MKTEVLFYLALSLVGIGAAHAKCDISVVETSVSNALSSVIKSIIHGPSYDAPCGSLASVLNKLANHPKTGGRRLENDKPLDPKEAQANLDAALKDPEIRIRMEKIRNEIMDENARLVYEAAILDEEGYYNARESKIQQLRQKLN